MKSTILYLALVLITFCCKKDVVLEPSLQIKPLVGVWKLQEIQVISDGQKTWQQVPYHKENDIDIRPDGVILDYKQEGVCCHPRELSVNGSIELVNYYTKFPGNTDCGVSCVQCQVWTIIYIEGELTLISCVDTDVKKYRR